MKACLILQRRFAYVGHAMAKVFKEKYGVNQFCAYTDLGASLEFLQSQTDIAYTDIFFEPEVRSRYQTEKLDLDYLKKLEKEIGIPNLWAYLEIDRSIRYGQLFRDYPHNTPHYTHEEMMRILQAEAKAIMKFLEKEKPNLIIFTVITDVSTLLFYHLAKKIGIKTFFIQTVRVGTRYTITENYENFSFLKGTFEALQNKKISLPSERKKALEFLASFRANPAPHCKYDTPSARPLSRSKQFLFLLPQNTLKSIYWFFKTGLEYFRWGIKGDHVRNPWHFLVDRLKRKWRVLIGFEDLYDKVDPADEFAFFPLQQEPEMALMLFAPFSNDQLWLAKQIARSLPLHYKLYVKEHPAMFGYRTRQFYKELKKIPNLKLIHPSVNGLDLITKAKIIATITSTAAWEGALLKKPAITFGDTFYNDLPMVKKCLAAADLPQVVKNQLENFHYDEEALLNLLTAIFKESVDVDLSTIWQMEGGGQVEKNKTAITSLVNFIAGKLGLINN